MDLSLMRACGRRGAGALRDLAFVRKSVETLVLCERDRIKMSGSVQGGERKPNGREELFVVKRFRQEGQSPSVDRGGTNKWIVLSGKDDDPGRRRNCAKLRLHLQAIHLRHMNIDQGNRRAMCARITQEFLGIAKRCCLQIS